ncbi:MAG: hypothetical protein NT080_10985 [Spirochaetes bacterium]|nr:hypothetical protein [Spirochaetota bacterium]
MTNAVPGTPYGPASPRLMRETEILERALESYRRPLAVTDRDFVERVAAVLPYLPRPGKIVATRNWVGTGLILGFSIVLVPFGAEYRVFRAFFGAGYSLPMALVSALIITAYCALFVSSHIRELANRIHTRRHGAVVNEREAG